MAELVEIEVTLPAEPDIRIVEVDAEIGRPSAGTFTLSSGAATVSNTSVTANSVVVMSLKTASGTISAQPYLTAVTAGTGFVVAGAATDNSVYNYIILEVT